MSFLCTSPASILKDSSLTAPLSNSCFLLLNTSKESPNVTVVAGGLFESGDVEPVFPPE